MKSPTMRVGRSVLAAVLLVTTIVVGVVVQPSAVAAAENPTIVVDSSGNRSDTNPQDGVCQTSRGNCTLRAAIETANARVGSDTIHFAISGSGIRTINVDDTQLPNVYDATGSLTIDGYTQSGAAPNNAQAGSNAQIRIQIIGTAGYGLRITSAENVVKGLAIAGFNRNLAIHYEQADGNRIQGNFIGPDASGNQVDGAGTGVHIWLGPDQNLIGGPDLADRNIISGNTYQGVKVEQGNTSRNTIQNNVIGLNPSLTDRLSQRTGLDIQWGTWGNLVGGVNPGEGNVISGNLQDFESNWGAVDLSHSSAGNLIIGNYMGTLGDGSTVTEYSKNTHGVLIKDDAKGNYIADNVIVNGRWDGIKHRHNFTGTNTFVSNRVGVGLDGRAAGNGRWGIRVNGHDDIYYDNISANNGWGGVVVLDQTFDDENTNFPPEQTLGNRLLYTTLYQNGGDAPAGFTPIDIYPDLGPNPNDPGDGDDGPHRLLNTPTITGLGQGQIYGQTCAGCEVHVYVSGSVASDGTLDTSGSNAGTGAGFIGWVTADGSGKYSLAHGDLRIGKTASTLTIDGAGNTSEMSAAVVPTNPYGIEGNPATSQPKVAAPQRPDLPPPYVSIFPGPFDCSHNSGELTWTDAGAAEYYVFANNGGNESYLGAKTGTSATVPDADSYRITHWRFGRPITATCDFSQPASFDCSVTNGVLSWSDAGASAYYIFATTGGVDTYLGGHSGTTLDVPAADSYRVTHWLSGGPTRATCDGAGPSFACSVSGGTLSWTDAGASAYYIFATTGGVDTYLGGHSGTSLAVQPADSYRITYWNGGTPIRATCP